MLILYSLLLACAVLLSLPWWAVQMLRSGKYRAGLAERLGWIPQRLKGAAQPGSIWVHAVSVGEVLAIGALVHELRRTYPERPVFVSTTTLTGQRLARERFGEDRVFFLPLDFGFAIRPYMNLLRPSLLVLAETEFWPNLLHRAKERGAAVAVVNARVSDRSLPRYRKFRWFFSRVLDHVDLFLAQSEEDALRLPQIGAPADRVRLTGNLKFDVAPAPVRALAEDLRRALAQGSPLIVCGSTTEGEESLLLAAFADALRRFPAAVLVLAPRHPERFDAVAALIGARGLAWARRTSPEPLAPLAGGVFLLDSIGELASVYALADIAFVGGSLLPVGGHNILEPARHGVAMMTGPHTFNFREIVRIFEQGGALKIVTAQDLSRELLRLLENAPQRKLLGSRARDLFTACMGATAKTLQALAPLLAEGAQRPA